MIVVVVAIDREDGVLLQAPEVMTQGVVGSEEEPEIIAGIRRLVTDMVGAESSHVDWTGIRDTLKEDVATYVHTQTRRRPLVLPITVEV